MDAQITRIILLATDGAASGVAGGSDGPGNALDGALIPEVRL